MFTRADYMSNLVTHNDYYGQFVTQDIKNLIEQTFTKERLIKALDSDEHLNNIPLHRWDLLAGLNPTKMEKSFPSLMGVQTIDRWNDTGGKSNLKSLVDIKQIKDAGECWSLSTAVCIAKEAARQIAKEP
jgi:hypothetical protein